jgi:hypothetical protein
VGSNKLVTSVNTNRRPTPTHNYTLAASILLKTINVDAATIKQWAILDSGVMSHFLITDAPAWLGILIFGSDFWDPHCKWNSDSVFDSKDSGWKFIFEIPMSGESENRNSNLQYLEFR